MTIKIYDTIYEPILLYRKANTQAQRSLVGYIIKSGQVHDPIFGGAFSLLRAIEHCNAHGEIYELQSIVDNDTKKKIMHVAQLALDGKLDKFTISERDRQDTIKYLCQPF